MGVNNRISMKFAQPRHCLSHLNYTDQKPIVLQYKLIDHKQRVWARWLGVSHSIFFFSQLIASTCTSTLSFSFAGYSLMQKVVHIPITLKETIIIMPPSWTQISLSPWLPVERTVIPMMICGLSFTYFYSVYRWVDSWTNLFCWLLIYQRIIFVIFPMHLCMIGIPESREVRYLLNPRLWSPWLDWWYFSRPCCLPMPWPMRLILVNTIIVSHRHSLRWI